MRQGDKVFEACGGSIEGKTIAVLGLTFKPNTDDMRDAPSLVIVPALQKAGATVRAFDPAGMAEARKLLDGVAWCEDAYDTMVKADALTILTEWNEFRRPDFQRIQKLMGHSDIHTTLNVYGHVIERAEADTPTKAGILSALAENPCGESVASAL